MSDEILIQRRDALMARDIDLIAQIRGYGVDLDKPRQIDLTFWAPDEATSNYLIDAMNRNEMPPSLVLGPRDPSSKDKRWLVRCAISGSVSFITSKENVVTFLLFADKYDCEYDGWGTAIVEAASANESATE